MACGGGSSTASQAPPESHPTDTTNLPPPQWPQPEVNGTVLNAYNKPADANHSTWFFEKPQYLLLNLAMGGVLGRPVPGPLTTDKMQVDYVRVYQ